ncbi:MAG: hypothetical protein GY777_13335 [Candidatus Brocadiaceae bacterium]|nr:hypothetical protein [Candidatus Brocadiaceae bacterium]
METSINWYEHFLGFTCSYKSSIKNPERAVMENKEIRCQPWRAKRRLVNPGSREAALLTRRA